MRPELWKMIKVKCCLIALATGTSPNQTMLLQPFVWANIHLTTFKGKTRMFMFKMSYLIFYSARAIIKMSGHQHQWFPGVSQVVTM